MSSRLWLIAAALAAATPCAAQTSQVVSTPPDFPRGKISGQVFADYYYNVVGDPRHAYDAAGADSGIAGIDGAANASGGPKNIGKDLNGFLFRRVYFQLDNDLSVRFSARFRLEVDSKSLTSDGKIGVAVKAAYLQARDVLPRGDFFFGILDTPTWDQSEDFWQYRAVEKMIADFRGVGSRADVGAELKGHFDTDHRFEYYAMLGNGTGQKPENNRYKKFYASLPARLGDFIFEPYADYENASGSRDKATYKIFSGYEFRKVAIGIEALDRVNHQASGGNQEPAGLSIFARGTMKPMLGAFARFDFWEPDRRASNRVDQQLWIAGLDWQPFKDLHFLPNIEATQYLAKGTALAPSHHDLQARITVYYKFSKPQS